MVAKAQRSINVTFEDVQGPECIIPRGLVQTGAGFYARVELPGYHPRRFGPFKTKEDALDFWNVPIWDQIVEIFLLGQEEYNKLLTAEEQGRPPIIEDELGAAYARG